MTGPRDRHAERNAAQVRLLRALVGSGFSPSVWCLNPGCHAPIRTDAATCPECGTATAGHAPRPPLVGRRDLVIRTFYRPAAVVADLHGQGHGEIQAVRSGHPEWIQTFPLPRCGCGELMECGDVLCADCEARR